MWDSSRGCYVLQCRNCHYNRSPPPTPAPKPHKVQVWTALFSSLASKHSGRGCCDCKNCLPPTLLNQTQDKSTCLNGMQTPVAMPMLDNLQRGCLPNCGPCSNKCSKTSELSIHLKAGDDHSRFHILIWSSHQPTRTGLRAGESGADEVRELLSSLPRAESVNKPTVDAQTFEEAYSDHFVASFLTDLNQVRDDGGNSTMVSYCLDSTAASYSPTLWRHFL